MATSKDEQTNALKAFKKRLKLYRRDDESSIGGGAFSAGRTSGIVGIRLPEGFPPEVWKDLEAAGRIRRIPGTETWELPKQP